MRARACVRACVCVCVCVRVAGEGEDGDRGRERDSQGDSPLSLEPDNTRLWSHDPEIITWAEIKSHTSTWATQAPPPLGFLIYLLPLFKAQHVLIEVTSIHYSWCWVFGLASLTMPKVMSQWEVCTDIWDQNDVREPFHVYHCLCSQIIPVLDCQTAHEVLRLVPCDWYCQTCPQIL